jgi:hypothetical protein
LLAAPVGGRLAALALLLWFGTVLGLPIVQLSRYWQVASDVERQQTKWVAFGFSLFGALAAGLLAPAIFQPSLANPTSFYNAIHTSILLAASTLLPFAIAFAILRYRLWDIDVLIRLTLVYGTLTGLLVVIYAGLIVGLESLVVALSGQTSQPVVIVVATLASAALFQPLRERIQRGIDRRFYRRKYDAAKTLAAFSATLQSEVDLRELSERLLEVVEETMQPVHLSLWLRQGAAQAEERAGERK